MPRESARVLGAVSGEGTGGQVLVASPVRKERLKKSKKELEEEAAKVLHQADRVACVAAENGVNPEKFYTLPGRKKSKTYASGSLDRRTRRRGSLESQPPKKPPRTFATISTPQVSQKPSIFDVFRKENKPTPKKPNLRRSVSDASNLKSKVKTNDPPFRKRSGSDSDEFVNVRNKKKQLSPIIEVTQREDYFEPVKEEDKENSNTELNGVKAPVRKKKKESITDKLKQFIDEVDEEIYKETGARPTHPKQETEEPTPIIIDVDKAEKISGKNKKFKETRIGKKLKSITHKKNKTNDASKIKKLPSSKIEEVTALARKSPVHEQLATCPAPRIKAAIDSLDKSNKEPTMIHSSQMPVEKLPLTKGRTVDSMVKRLSSDSCSPPPPKTNIMIIPQCSNQHNNNQPFSYTRGLSPEKYGSNDTHPNPSSPIIYAQVVCGGNTNGAPKQTIHTAYTNGKKHPHSDSDEGLGGEENSGFSRLSKTVTHFGDSRINDYFDEVDKFEEEESPITPKFRSPAFVNGYSSYEKKDFTRVEQNGFIDLSSRGRGDGMDAKRRESLTEQYEPNITPKHIPNGRSDLSARRDLLESRINRRLNDNTLRTSPEYKTNVYVSESTSKYRRGGSSSPVGFTEKYVSETKIDKYGKPHTTEARSKQYFGNQKEYNSRIKSNGYQYNGFENEPKSFDSQISDYRSSPENRNFDTCQRYNARAESKHLVKDRNLYKSTPDLYLRSYQDSKYSDSYHDSFRREKTENNITSSSKYRSERFLDDSERKDKFGDSGIENDFRRDSGENYRVPRPSQSRREYCNDSEDEGFASSLLIASERQHTEDSINQRKRRDYDSDRTYSREDDPYRHIESMEYKQRFRANDYVPRERSIDDGSHYDPRIDKEVDRSTLKRVEKKPPKPEKKSGLEKVKSLFTSKKKKEKPLMVPEESLRSRYIEYKGRETVEPKYKKKEVNEVRAAYNDGVRRRQSSPSNSPSRVASSINSKSTETNGSWFKSLDRLARKKSKKEEGNLTSGTEEETPSPTKAPTKNLRFFGDTDIESNDSLRGKAPPNSKTRLGGMRSHSTRDLHNISEELKNSPDLSSTRRRSSHKSMTNIAESDRDVRGSRVSLKPPASPVRRAQRETVTRSDRSRRRKNEVSSVESSTEGDSSQQSQRSIVYLHAATVGDIPGPGYLRNGRRAASREELTSNSSSRIQPQVKTLSRSFSVLAPWKPRHPREAMEVDYTQYPKPVKNGKYEQKVSKNSNRKDNSSTLKKKAQETKKSNSTLNRRSKSKENVSQNLRRSKEELSKGSNSTLYKKKERLPRENSRYNREEKKISPKSLSVESLSGNDRKGRRSREETRDVARSVSMPRDPEKSAGWFKLTKKKQTGSTQRL